VQISPIFILHFVVAERREKKKGEGGNEKGRLPGDLFLMKGEGEREMMQCLRGRALKIGKKEKERKRKER